MTGVPQKSRTLLSTSSAGDPLFQIKTSCGAIGDHVAIKKEQLREGDGVLPN